MNLPQPVRDKAGREADTWELVGLTFPLLDGGIGVGAVLAGVALSPLLIASLPVIGAVGAIFAWRKAKSAHRKREDPPRDDYTVTTTVEYQEISLVNGDHPFELALDDMVGRGLQAVALEDAMVLADERAQGAQLAGIEWAAAARRSESQDFGRQGAFANIELSEATARLAGILETTEIKGDVSAMPIGPLRSRLPDHVVAELEAAGFDLGPLEMDVERARSATAALGDDPIQALAATIRAAGQATREYAVAYLEVENAGPAVA